MQSLFIGDFLVRGEPSQSTQGTPTSEEPKQSKPPMSPLEGIRECFVQPPFRYRLKPEQALANYTKAVTLSTDAIKAGPQAADISVLRNYKIVALLGLWNVAGEPKYLAEAVKEAKAALATDLPEGTSRRRERSAKAGTDVVARFCLAKDRLRSIEAAKRESVVSEFMAGCGGDQAPASAVAAAAILALDANARDLHERYRAKLLAVPDGDNPMLWPVVTFLRDRIHTYDLLRGNYVWLHRQRERASIRGHITNRRGTSTNRLPAITLKTLDGATLDLPRDMNGKVTLLVFVEPSAEPNAEFRIDADEEGKDQKEPHHSFLRHACNLADKYVNQDVVAIAAFLSDDAERIAALMKTRKLTYQAAMVPGGLANPMVRRLGILSADRTQNVFLLRRDGTIAWQVSGVPHVDNFAWVHFLATRGHIEALSPLTPACGTGGG